MAATAAAAAVAVTLPAPATEHEHDNGAHEELEHDSDGEQGQRQLPRSDPDREPERNATSDPSPHGGLGIAGGAAEVRSAIEDQEKGKHIDRAYILIVHAGTRTLYLRLRSKLEREDWEKALMSCMPDHSASGSDKDNIDISAPGVASDHATLGGKAAAEDGDYARGEGGVGEAKRTHAEWNSNASDERRAQLVSLREAPPLMLSNPELCYSLLASSSRSWGGEILRSGSYGTCLSVRVAAPPCRQNRHLPVLHFSYASALHLKRAPLPPSDFTR